MSPSQSASPPSPRNAPTRADLERVQTAADLFAKQLRDAGFDINIPTIRAEETSRVGSKETSGERERTPDDEESHHHRSMESSDEIVKPRKRVVMQEDTSYQKAYEIDEEEEEEDDDRELLAAAMRGRMEAEHMEDDGSDGEEEYRENEYPDEGDSGEGSPMMRQSRKGSRSAEASETIFKKSQVRLSSQSPDSRPDSRTIPPAFEMENKRRSLSPRHFHDTERHERGTFVPVSAATALPEHPEYAFEDMDSSVEEPARRKIAGVLRRSGSKRNGVHGDEVSSIVEREVSSKTPLRRAAPAAAVTGVAARMKGERSRSRSPLADDSSRSIPSDRVDTLGRQAEEAEERKEDTAVRTKSGKLQQTLIGRRNSKHANDTSNGGDKERKNTMSRLFGRSRQKDEGEREEAPAKEVLPPRNRSPKIVETEMERHLRHQREKLEARERKIAESDAKREQSMEEMSLAGRDTIAATAARNGAMALTVHPPEQPGSPHRVKKHYTDPVGAKPLEASLGDAIIDRRESRQSRRREREEQKRALARRDPQESDDALNEEFTSDKNDILLAARARAQSKAGHKDRSSASALGLGAASAVAVGATAGVARGTESGDRSGSGSRKSAEYEEARRLRREARRKRRAAEKAEASTTEKMRRSLGTKPKIDLGSFEEMAGADSIGAAAVVGDRKKASPRPPTPPKLPLPQQSSAASHPPEDRSPPDSGDMDAGSRSRNESPGKPVPSTDLQQIDEDMREVLQRHPESFRPPPLLYLPVKISGVSLGAVVDTAAQASFITLSSARRVGLERLMDRRFAGNASGNATTSGGIVGRVHICTMIVGTTAVRCSLAVSESGPKGRATKMPDIVIGADVLLNTNAILDLKRKRLVIGQDKTTLQLDVM